MAMYDTTANQQVAEVTIIFDVKHRKLDILNTRIPANPCKIRQHPNAVSYLSAKADDIKPGKRQCNNKNIDIKSDDALKQGPMHFTTSDSTMTMF